MRLARGAALCASALALVSCAHPPAAPQTAKRPALAATLREASDAKLPPLHGRLAELEFDSPALRGNLLGDATARSATVYLPPAYAREPARRFPVIYSLGGFPPPPTNSPATGRWEDLVAGDLVAAADGHLRTLADRAHRGLYGGSMGGFGAISIAMHRPRVFGTVFAQSPCCLDMVGELAPNPLWRGLLGIQAIEPVRCSRRGTPRRWR